MAVAADKLRNQLLHFDTQSLHSTKIQFAFFHRTPHCWWQFGFHYKKNGRKSQHSNKIDYSHTPYSIKCIQTKLNTTSCGHNITAHSIHSEIYAVCCRFCWQFLLMSLVRKNSFHILSPPWVCFCVSCVLCVWINFCWLEALSIRCRLQSTSVLSCMYCIVKVPIVPFILPDIALACNFLCHLFVCQRQSAPIFLYM